MEKRYAAAAFLWALVMLVATITPGNAIEPVGKIPFASIIFHLGEFLVFGWLLSKAFPSLQNPLLISLSYSIITEVLQLYVPGRFFSYNDIAMNMAGSIFGIGAPSALAQSHIFLQLKNKLDAWSDDRNP